MRRQLSRPESRSFRVTVVSWQAIMPRKVQNLLAGLSPKPLGITCPIRIFAECPYRTSADAGERVADEQGADPRAAEGRLQLHDPRLAVGHVADDRRAFAERMAAQRRDRAVGA